MVQSHLKQKPSADSSWWGTAAVVFGSQGTFRGQGEGNATELPAPVKGGTLSPALVAPRGCEENTTVTNCSAGGQWLKTWDSKSLFDVFSVWGEFLFEEENSLRTPILSKGKRRALSKTIS